jgi:hypothetical protein
MEENILNTEENLCMIIKDAGVFLAFYGLS